MRPRVSQLKLEENEDSSKSTAAGPSQSPDLSPTETLRWDFKTAVSKQVFTNFTELWAKIPPQQCVRLTKSHRKRLRQVVATKGGPTVGCAQFSHTASGF